MLQMYAENTAVSAFLRLSNESNRFGSSIVLKPDPFPEKT